MRKSVLLIFLIFLASFLVKGQHLTNEIQEHIFKGDFASAQNLITTQINDGNISKHQEAELYHLEGDMLKIAGDIDGALVSWGKAAKIRDAIYPNKNDHHHAWKYANLSNFHYEKINRKLTKIYADSCLQLLNNLNLNQQKELKIYNIWNILGQSIKQQGNDSESDILNDYEKCIEFYTNSLEYQRKQKTPIYHLANTYHLLGNAYLDLTLHYSLYKDTNKTKHYQNQAVIHYDKALTLWESEFGSTHYQLAKTYFVKGLLFHYLIPQNQSYSSTTIKCFNNSLNAFGLDLISQNKKNISETPNKGLLLMCLKYYTSNLLKLHDASPSSVHYLEEAEKVNQLALRAWTHIHEQFKSDNTNQNLAIYNMVPQQEQLAILMRKNSSDEFRLKDEFFRTNQKYKYYDLFKHQTAKNDLGLKEFQKRLKPKQAFLDFHLSDLNKEVYILKISSSDSKLMRINSNTVDDVKALRKAILEIDFNNFQNTSLKIFKLVFPEGLNDIDELIICPDNIFNAIPFEALLCSNKDIESKDYRKLDYLINHVGLRHVLTPNSLSNELIETSWDLNVFTPSFPSMEFAELPFSNKFGQDARNNIDAKSYVGEEATLSTLKATRSSIIHISTHAVIGEDVTSNFIQFSDGPFYQSEISQLSSEPNLIILNTCNSGMGQLLVGDGINGFVREIHRAGVKSTISNLWEVDDKASNDLFRQFYLFLKDGQTSSMALREAKLNHIKNAPSSELGAPYYWGGHVLVGSDKCFQKRRNISNVVLVILGSLITVVLFFFLKLLKMKNKP